jgi:hypothetical protein
MLGQSQQRQILQEGGREGEREREVAMQKDDLLDGVSATPRGKAPPSTLETMIYTLRSEA